MANQDEFQKAVALIKTGSYESAKTALYTVLKSDPENDKAWVAMYYCVPASKDKRMCLERALSINPRNPAAKKFLSRLDQAAAPSSDSPSGPNSESPEAAGLASSSAISRKTTNLLIVIGISLFVILSIIATLALTTH